MKPDLSSLLPEPAPLWRSALIKICWGSCEGEAVATAASVCEAPWEDTGEQVTWLHFKGSQIWSGQAGGAKSVQRYLVPLRYVTDVKIGPKYRVTAAKPSEDLALFPPIHPDPSGNLTRAEIERRLAPPSDAERLQLEAFVRLVLAMHQCRFVRRVRTQDHSLRVEPLKGGGYRVIAPDYDWDDLRSFLTAFRQIALSDSEPVYLPRIRNIISKYAGEVLREELKKLKTHIVPIIEGKLEDVRFGKELPDGDISLSSYELLDVLVNGVIFHSDSRHERAAKLILSTEPGEYLWIVLIEIVYPVLNACTWIVNVMQSEGLLPESEFISKNPLAVAS